MYCSPRAAACLTSEMCVTTYPVPTTIRIAALINTTAGAVPAKSCFHTGMPTFSAGTETSGWVWVVTDGLFFGALSVVAGVVMGASSGGGVVATGFGAGVVGGGVAGIDGVVVGGGV